MMRPKIAQVIIGISIFERPSSQTVQLAIGAWTSNFIFLLFQCSGCVQSKNKVDSVVVGIFL